MPHSGRSIAGNNILHKCFPLFVSWNPAPGSSVRAFSGHSEENIATGIRLLYRCQGNLWSECDIWGGGPGLSAPRGQSSGIGSLCS